MAGARIKRLASIYWRTIKLNESSFRPTILRRTALSKEVTPRSLIPFRNTVAATSIHGQPVYLWHFGRIAFRSDEPRGSQPSNYYTGAIVYFRLISIYPRGALSIGKAKLRIAKAYF